MFGTFIKESKTTAIDNGDTLKEVRVKFSTTNHDVQNTHIHKTPAVIGNSVESAPCKVKLHLLPKEPRVASNNCDDKDVEQNRVADIVPQPAESGMTVNDVLQSQVDEDTKDRIGHFENHYPNVPQQRIPQEEQILPVGDDDRHQIPASESSAGEPSAMPSFRYKCADIFMYLYITSMILFKL